MKLRLLFLPLLVSILFFNFSHSQETFVPDDIFEAYLIEKGYDTVLDNYVTTANISNVTSVNISGRNVTDLTGLQDFTALSNLNVSGTLILNLDVSNNTSLTNLNAFDTAIGSLDVSNNAALTILYVDNTFLNSLDVSANSALTTLDISNTEINSLDVSNNMSLLSLSISETAIISLDVSNNTSLTFLTIYNTLISSLDVSSNINLATLKATNTQNLYCIAVADEIAANANAGIYFEWEKDAACGYSTICDLTYVPDDIFEQYLITAGYDAGPLDDYVPTANIKNIPSVDLSNTDVADLTGIEDFTALTMLDVSNSLLTEINVSSNILLNELFLSNTSISSLNVVLNASLTTLNTLTTPNLDCISVADENAAIAGTGIYFNWDKDEACDYRENCSAPLSDSDFNFSEAFVGPNPIKDELHIVLNNFTVLNNVSVFDISGKLILKSNSTTIFTSQLESGIYLVQVTTDKGSFMRKLLKQ